MASWTAAFALLAACSLTSRVPCRFGFEVNGSSELLSIETAAETLDASEAISMLAARHSDDVLELDSYGLEEKAAGLKREVEEYDEMATSHIVNRWSREKSPEFRIAALTCDSNRSEPARVLVIQTDTIVSSYFDLYSMYSPVRETLVAGLESRARKCGYIVNAVIGYDAAKSQLKNGDMAIFVGVRWEPLQPTAQPKTTIAS